MIAFLFITLPARIRMRNFEKIMKKIAQNFFPRKIFSENIRYAYIKKNKTDKLEEEKEEKRRRIYLSQFIQCKFN